MSRRMNVLVVDASPLSVWYHSLHSRLRNNYDIHLISAVEETTTPIRRVSLLNEPAWEHTTALVAICEPAFNELTPTLRTRLDLFISRFKGKVLALIDKDDFTIDKDDFTMTPDVKQKLAARAVQWAPLNRHYSMAKTFSDSFLLLKSTESKKPASDLASLDKALDACLTNLQLRFSREDNGLLAPSENQPILCFTTNQKVQRQLWYCWQSAATNVSSNEMLIEDVKDEIVVQRTLEVADPSWMSSATTNSNRFLIRVASNFSNEPKRINGFDPFEYLSHLMASSASSSDFPFGSALLFTHSISSTQQFLSNNYKFFKSCHSGLVFVAEEQTHGRGRSGNTWISSLGCLQFSLVLRYSQPMQHSVFIQYLMALAVVKAVRSFIHPHFPIFIKWPNDIYLDPEGRPHDPHSVKSLGQPLVNEYTFEKIGGILVNAQHVSGTTFGLIVGAGLNVMNETPTICLRQVMQRYLEKQCLKETVKLSQALVLSCVMREFEKLYASFDAETSFQPFLEEYYSYWMHSNQIVWISPALQETSLDGYPKTDDEEKESRKATIKGITNQGYLLATDWNDPSIHYQLSSGRSSLNLTSGMLVQKI